MPTFGKKSRNPKRRATTRERAPPGVRERQGEGGGPKGEAGSFGKCPLLGFSVERRSGGERETHSRGGKVRQRGEIRLHRGWTHLSVSPIEEIRLSADRQAAYQVQDFCIFTGKRTFLCGSWILQFWLADGFQSMTRGAMLVGLRSQQVVILNGGLAMR